jgi:hypothetical protein
LQEFAKILGYVGVGSGCLPISFCLLFFKETLKRLHWTLLLLSLTYFFTNILTLLLFLDKNLLQENLFYIHYSIELVLLTVFLFRDEKPKVYVKLAFIGILVFTILVTYLINTQLFKTSDSIFLFSNITLIIFSINVVFNEYYNSETENLTQNGTFFIASSVLFYAGIQLYFSLFETIIREYSTQIFYYLWPINQLGGIIYYISFTYGLWKLAKS